VGSQRRVFVSYSRSDFNFAEQLVVALRRRNLEAWFDVHELAPGSDWSAAIDRAIQACDVFVVVASRAALESPYVQRERELAARLGRPQVAVQARRARGLGPLPTYDLRSSFKRGADRLAGDLAAGTPTGWRPRLRLPCPVGAALYALAPALSVAFAVVLGASFLHHVVGHRAVAATHVGLRLALVGAFVALAALPSAWLLWAFLRRRAGWLNLRGSLLTMPVIAIAALTTTEAMAGALASDLGAVVTALGASFDIQLVGAEALAVLLFPACLVAAVVTELSPGLCRVLKTGAAPRRIRSRHVGAVPRPDAPVALRTYRLTAAEADGSVGEEVRRALSATGISEAADGERDVVVLSDRTPTDWLARDDLRDPLAVVATSIAVPVRGVLQRFQWVDYRARRKSTLETLARDSAAQAQPGGKAHAAPGVPEGLQRLRLPVAVTISEWTLYSMATVATFVPAYRLALAVSGDPRGDAWPSGLCLLVAPVPVFLALRLRRRRITPLLLVSVVALCWLTLVALGMDGVLRERFSDSNVGSHSAATVTYPALTAVVFALSWKSLRRWLPRQSGRPPGQQTLGSPRGSLLWLTMLVPLLLSTVVEAVLVPAPTQAPASSALTRPAATAPAPVCRDRTRLDALGTPLHAAELALARATKKTVAAAFVRRTRVARSAAHNVEGYEPSSKWGAQMKARLIAALRRTVRADQAYLHRQLSFKQWRAEYRDLDRVADDLFKPVC
jgi:hypothetical protein